MTLTERCVRCLHAVPYQTRPKMLLIPAAYRCGWCHARTKQKNLVYDPYLHHFGQTLEEGRRRRSALELSPANASARWDEEERPVVLRYLALRDGGRCGLCAMTLLPGQGQIEHVIPKKFGRFEFDRGSARLGSGYESLLHLVDNLQAAHDYCNSAKGNRGKKREWRHPELNPLPAARDLARPGDYLWVPDRPPAPDLSLVGMPSDERSQTEPGSYLPPPPPPPPLQKESKDPRRPR